MIDSIITSKKLEDISEEKLGSWRLEKEIYEGIILSGDKYAYKTKEGEENVYWPTIKEKIGEIKYEDFKKMLKKGAEQYIEIDQQRIDYKTGKKVIKQYKYQLNKSLPNRKKVYNKDNIWTDTMSSIVERSCGWVV